MITVKEALHHIRQQCHTLPPIRIPLDSACNFIAAETIYAPIDVPCFDNSAMDGYAIRYEDLKNTIPLQLYYEIEAGKTEIPEVHKGEVARIFTGAPIPIGADTVIPQENCTVENGILNCLQTVSIGDHIRKQGTQTRKGDRVLSKGNLLTAEYIGFLATLGIDSVVVFPKPKVGIIITGKELVPVGNTLQNGQIYESNSVALKVLLQQLEIPVVFSQWIDDNESELFHFVSENFTKVDVLLLTGGISVGDYDFVKRILDKIGTTEIFYKIQQKPGKPLFFGKKDQTLFFGLPGNPSAVVTCFHAYIKPALLQITGDQPQAEHDAILVTPYRKKSGLTHFVKARVQGGKATILDKQLSYQMDTYAQANAFVVLNEEQEDFKIGEKVRIIFFYNYKDIKL